MRFLIAKAIISLYLCHQAYVIALQPIASEAISDMLKMNIASLELHPSNAMFLDRYLSIIIAFCMAESILSVISRNMLPKVVTIFGLILWICLGFHPRLPGPTRLMQTLEYLAIIGALLFIGGSERLERDVSV
jgi:hypothetical protein